MLANIIWFLAGFFAIAAPSIVGLILSYVRFPPLWWRRRQSRRITGPYRWRVYE